MRSCWAPDAKITMQACYDSHWNGVNPLYPFSNHYFSSSSFLSLSVIIVLSVRAGPWGAKEQALKNWGKQTFTTPSSKRQYRPLPWFFTCWLASQTEIPSLCFGLTFFFRYHFFHWHVDVRLCASLLIASFTKQPALGLIWNIISFILVWPLFNSGFTLLCSEVISHLVYFILSSCRLDGTF